MANGYRANRQDSLEKKISSILGNGFRTWLTGKTVRDAGCSTRVFRRECVECLPRFTGMHRFLPTLAAMQGFRLSETPVNHRPRVKGLSKYSIRNRLWVSLVDMFGVLWLKKRTFHCEIKVSSDLEPDRQSRTAKSVHPRPRSTAGAGYEGTEETEQPWAATKRLADVRQD